MSNFEVELYFGVLENVIIKRLVEILGNSSRGDFRNDVRLYIA